MKRPPLLVNEPERLTALHKYNILDTLPEAGYDDITRIAAVLCDMPISLITIIDEDRQWVKSHYGFFLEETSLDASFCVHTINHADKLLVIPDLRKDERFSNNPFVTGDPHAVFYAGMPLVSPEGHVVGALCVLDSKPRKLDAAQEENLMALARQAVALLELRRRTELLKRKSTELKYVYTDLEKLSHIASHDLKSPLNNIISLTHLLLEDYAPQLDAEGKEYIGFLNDAAYRLSDMVSGILSYSRSSKILVNDKELVSVTALIAEVIALLNVPAAVTIVFGKGSEEVFASRLALREILLHLVHNATKYADKENGRVEVKFYEDKTSFTFEVKDNGCGIAADNTVKIFDLFERLNSKGVDGESMGIGLAIVKRLVEKSGGEISVISEIGKGTSFLFSIPK